MPDTPSDSWLRTPQGRPIVVLGAGCQPKYFSMSIQAYLALTLKPLRLAQFTDWPEAIFNEAPGPQGCSCHMLVLQRVTTTSEVEADCHTTSVIAPDHFARQAVACGLLLMDEFQANVAASEHLALWPWVCTHRVYVSCYSCQRNQSLLAWQPPGPWTAWWFYRVAYPALRRIRRWLHVWRPGPTTYRVRARPSPSDQ